MTKEIKNKFQKLNIRNSFDLSSRDDEVFREERTVRDD